MDDYSDKIPVIAVVCIFLLIQVLSLYIAPYYQDTGIKAFEDPTSILNALYFIVIMIFATVVILLLSRYNMKWVIHGLLIFSIFLTLYIGFDTFILGFIVEPTSSALLHAVSLILSVFLTVILFKFKRWYIINFVGVILAVTISVLFGVSLIPIVSLILLLLLAIYDYISVYKTKHMITLADDLIDYNLPLLLIIPKKKSFSMDEMEKINPGQNISRLEIDESDELSDLDNRNGKNGERYTKKDRKTLMIGLGDMIIPTIFVVSSNVYIGLLPAIGSMIGGTIGLFLLLRDIGNSKPKAGLPFLNGGVILGFLITLLSINII